MADNSPFDFSYNRYSMPVTRSRTGFYNATSDLDQTGTARFLFGEEDGVGDSKYGQSSNDSFPTLVRRDDQMVCLYYFHLACCVLLLPFHFFPCPGFFACLVNRIEVARSSLLSTIECNSGRVKVGLLPFER